MLLNPNDPNPIFIYNKNSLSPLILLADHGGRAIPQKLNNLGLSSNLLKLHIAYDIGIKNVGIKLAQYLDSMFIMNHYSRLVIDCNRATSSPDCISPISDNILIPGNNNLLSTEQLFRVTEIYLPYHNYINNIINHSLQNHKVPILVSLHSFTPVMQGYQRPWHIGILWNRDKRLATLMFNLLKEDTHLCVGDNQPYSGQTCTGYTLPFHAESLGIPHVLIELKQDLIDHEDGVCFWAKKLFSLLKGIILNKNLHQIKKH
ncbi:MAG: N-formylglutamate amidohydrolase [Alphaproteobacteria bacterium]|nr:N-formylglutamate amidohydrolase [Alphaproteobacteria bacterium]